jgi:hypothetical protein
MQPLAPPPIFIKSNFVFKIREREFSFLNHGVSVFGITGLKWTHFDPIDRVGEKVQITIDVLAKQRFSLTTAARLTSEQTTDATYLGMRFDLSEFDKMKLTGAIAREGFCPTEYIRKYPRIPAVASVAAMPLRVIAQEDSLGELMVFDVANVSPNGILLHSENPKAILFQPGSRIRAQVEPRADLFHAFDFEGVVCRLVMDKHPALSNITRYLGIRFLNIPKDQKAHFLDLLKVIVKSFQIQGLVKKPG